MRVKSSLGLLLVYYLQLLVFHLNSSFSVRWSSLIPSPLPHTRTHSSLLHPPPSPTLEGSETERKKILQGHQQVKYLQPLLLSSHSESTGKVGSLGLLASRYLLLLVIHWGFREIILSLNSIKSYCAKVRCQFGQSLSLQESSKPREACPGVTERFKFS